MRTISLFCLILAIILLAACVQPTPTKEPPTITPTRPTSPIEPSPSPTRATSPLVPLALATPTPVPPLVSNLENGNFEGEFICYGGATCVAEHWNYGFVNPPCDPDVAGCYVTCPVNCINERGKCNYDPGCYWMQPEFAWSPFSSQWFRVHSGLRAQRFFGWGRQMEGWLWRQVEVETGNLYEFSAWFEAWQCTNPDKCRWGAVSDLPAKMHLRVGIDPMGGTSITSTNVIWSEIESFDQWSRASVMAYPAAGSDLMTVYIYARADWFDRAWRMNSDVYVDDANLSIVRGMAYLPVIMK